jgi:hypothetical protein
MLHPSEVAVDYIFHRLSDAYIDPGAPTKRLISGIGRLRKAIAHKPFDPEGEAHQKFLRSQLELIEGLEREGVPVDFGEERACIMQYLRN